MSARCPSRIPVEAYQRPHNLRLDPPLISMGPVTITHDSVKDTLVRGWTAALLAQRGESRAEDLVGH